jgi:hypothetical protein
MTKLEQLLIIKDMTNRDLQKAILQKHGVLIGEDRISKMVNGLLINIHINTAKLIATTLGVSIDDIVD